MNKFGDFSLSGRSRSPQNSIYGESIAPYPSYIGSAIPSYFECYYQLPK